MNQIELASNVPILSVNNVPVLKDQPEDSTWMKVSIFVMALILSLTVAFITYGMVKIAFKVSILHSCLIALPFALVILVGVMYKYWNIPQPIQSAEEDRKIDADVRTSFDSSPASSIPATPPTKVTIVDQPTEIVMFPGSNSSTPPLTPIGLTSSIEIGTPTAFLGGTLPPRVSIRPVDPSLKILCNSPGAAAKQT